MSQAMKSLPSLNNMQMALCTTNNDFLQAPVLAKRKTKAMKEMEEASAKRTDARGKAAARKAMMTQQFVIPDHTTTDYERQLKKIATRGGEMRLHLMHVCHRQLIAVLLCRHYDPLCLSHTLRRINPVCLFAHMIC